MTESQWFASKDPDELYRDRFGLVPRPERKLRLFACGCCRQIWDYIEDPRCRTAVEVAELYSDGVATEQQFDSAFDAVEEACDEIIASYPQTIKESAAYAAQMALRTPSDVYYPVAWVLARAYGSGPTGQYLAQLADLFRDVFDNPYDPASVQTSWLTDQVRKLAYTIYNERAFSRMRELATALEETGCRDSRILDHCRNESVHVRGCWVVDALIGK